MYAWALSNHFRQERGDVRRTFTSMSRACTDKSKNELLYKCAEITLLVTMYNNFCRFYIKYKLTSRRSREKESRQEAARKRDYANNLRMSREKREK